MTDLPLRLELAIRALPGSVPEKARRFGVHRSTLHRWAAGSARPTDEQIAALAEALGILPAVLHYGPTPVLRSCLPVRRRGR